MTIYNSATKLREDKTTKSLGGFRIEPVYPEDDNGLFNGEHKGSGAAIFLLRCDSLLSSRPTLPNGTKSFGISYLDDSESSPPVTCIVLEQKGHSEAFVEVIERILKRFKALDNSAIRPKAFIGCVEKYIADGKQKKPDALSQTEQLGLYSELWFLDYLLELVSDPNVAVSGWTGPKSAPKDFQLDCCAVEVKSTTSATQKKITISNSNQLHTTEDRPLFVLFMQFEDVQKCGDTLNKKVAKIRGTLKESKCLPAFERCLKEMKYDCRPAYDVTGYNYIDKTFYNVRDGFPCFQKSDEKSGMCKIRYQLEIGSLDQFRAPEADVVELLRKTGASNKKHQA